MARGTLNMDQTGRTNTYLTPEKADRFVSLVRDYDWPFKDRSMGSGDLLVTTSDCMELLADKAAALHVKLCTPATLSALDISGINRVFVILRRGERAFVNDLRCSLNPMPVISVTYGTNGPIAGLEALRQKIAGRAFVGATESNGLDYLSTLMTRNDMGHVTELMPEPDFIWATLVEDFKPLRYWCARIQNSGREGASVYSSRIDHLEYFRASTGFRYLHLKRLLGEADVRLIYFVQRDKINQALRVSQKPGFAAQAPGQEPTIQDVLDLILSLTVQESGFELLVQMMPLVRMVTHEELVESPVEVIKALCQFMGYMTPASVRVIRARDQQANNEKLAQRYEDIRVGLVERLALN